MKKGPVSAAGPGAGTGSRPFQPAPAGLLPVSGQAPGVSRAVTPIRFQALIIAIAAISSASCLSS